MDEWIIMDSWMLDYHWLSSTYHGLLDYCGSSWINSLAWTSGLSGIIADRELSWIIVEYRGLADYRALVDYLE